MPTNTYSDRVNIIKYVKLDEGWRFAPLARKTNGNILWDAVLVEGVEMRHPEGRYFIEWRQDGRRRRKSVGTIPSEILAAAQRQRAILNLRATGVEVKEPEPSARMTYLQDASAKYLRDVQMNKARSTTSTTAKRSTYSKRRSKRPRSRASIATTSWTFGLPLQAWHGRPHSEKQNHHRRAVPEEVRRLRVAGGRRLAHLHRAHA